MIDCLKRTILENKGHGRRGDEALNLLTSSRVIHQLVGDDATEISKIDANNAAAVDQGNEVIVSVDEGGRAIELCRAQECLASRDLGQRSPE